MSGKNPSQHLRCLWNSGGSGKVAEKSFIFSTKLFWNFNHYVSLYLLALGWSHNASFSFTSKHCFEYKNNFPWSTSL